MRQRQPSAVPAPALRASLSYARKRVLIVNAFFDEYRRTGGSPARVPRAMGPVFLAGVFSPELCELRLYSEQYSGPLHDPRLLGWPDMLVLTGVTTSFDRMLHLTAYARSLNSKVIVVAGGAPVRALPRRARRFFDYVCLGDIEELAAVVGSVFGPDYAAAETTPRFDLFPARGFIGYAESSRNCNFRCNFCSLTGEQVRYQGYDLDYIRRQIMACGKKQIVFIDNNFYGNDRRFFRARVDMLKELYREGRISGWSALVTADFFRDPENLACAREAGCQSLFSGIESFDAATLRAQNKRHNTLTPQVELIRNCLEAGIVFSYGIMLDPSARRLADLRHEIGFIVDTPEITLPAFFTLPIPLLGTPYFRECLERGLFLPNIRLRDMDGVTLVTHPLDPIEDALSFVRDLPNLRGFRLRALRQMAGFLGRYRSTLSPLQLTAAMVSGALICTQSAASAPLRPHWGRPHQTFYGPTETLDPLYRPRLHLDARYEGHFRPTQVIDAEGCLAADVVADLAVPPAAAVRPA